MRLRIRHWGIVRRRKRLKRKQTWIWGGRIALWFIRNRKKGYMRLVEMILISFWKNANIIMLRQMNGSKCRSLVLHEIAQQLAFSANLKSTSSVGEPNINPSNSLTSVKPTTLPPKNGKLFLYQTSHIGHSTLAASYQLSESKILIFGGKDQA